MLSTQNTCLCHYPPFSASDFSLMVLGVDTTNGRYGDVKVEVCRQCKTSWLSYLVEYEAFPNSARWYRGIIEKDDIESMSPEKAPQYLEGLAWYFVGGSHFGTNGKIEKGKVFLDI